jgi:ADYC domain
MAKGWGRRGARRRSSRWPARAALAVLVASSDACTCAVGPPVEPSGSGAGEVAGAGGAGGAARPGGAGGAVGQGGEWGLSLGCRKPAACRLPAHPASLMSAHCPTGSSCDVGSTNGRGIYVARELGYCMFDDSNPGVFYCPEAFVNLPAGGVSLVLRDAQSPLTTRKATVTAWKISPTGQRLDVTLLGVRAEQTDLFLRYAEPGAAAVEAHGADLAALRLQVADPTAPTGFIVTIQIEPAAARSSNAVRRYVVTYRSTDGGRVVRSHCDGRGVSFLPGRLIDGLTTQVTAAAGATTMSCETGAIDSCVDWGYAPWAPKAAGTPGAGEYLFATCLQAKRAAYYASLGDTSSYTIDGTMVYKRDPFGVVDQAQGPADDTWEGGIEAIWSPRGAECFNYDNRRRPDFKGGVPRRPEVPPCSPAQWTEAGKIATMPKRPAAPK